MICIGQRVITTRLLAAVALALLLVPLLPRAPLVAPPPMAAALAVNQSAIYRGAPIEAFDLARDEGQTGSPASTRGGVFLLAHELRTHFWGTYLGGDAFTGTLVSTPFVIANNVLYVPVIGYPSSMGNRLALEVLDESGRVLSTVDYTDGNPRETPRTWELDLRAWQGQAARLILVDTLTGPGGWLGAGRPIASATRGLSEAWKQSKVASYGRFAIDGLFVAVLLLLPGCYIRTAYPRSMWGDTAFLALPGLLGMAVCGLIMWVTRSAGDRWLASLILGIHAVLALRMLFHPWHRQAAACPGSPLWPVGVWAAVVMSAVAIGVSPMPVAAEFAADSALPGRMVASPPDHHIVYRTAVYFWHGKDGGEDTQAYFGDWSPASRGPVVPFAAVTLLSVLGVSPGDPPGLDREIWPATPGGEHVVRMLGWMTNALVVLAGWRLLSVLAAPERASKVALAWLALAPVTLINTVFLWPKYLATAFVLLAGADILQGRIVRAGLLAALGWLSHPVAALFLPALALLSGQAALGNPTSAGAGGIGRLRATLTPMAILTLVVLATMAPWLLFKWSLGNEDPFLRYPLGDGRGFAEAESLGSWLGTRWDNLRLTLLPGAFFFSERMQTWLGASLSEPLRWTIQYAKTLPGNLGFAGFALACAALAGRPAGNIRLIWIHFGGVALATMLLYWGFSSDGFGRNCLEPMSVALLIAAAAGWKRSSSPLVPLALAGVFLEGMWVVISGFVGAEGFSWRAWAWDAWGWLLLAVAIGAGVLVWAIAIWRSPWAEAAPECHSEP